MILLLFIMLAPIAAQDFYWEDPQILIPRRALYPQVLEQEDQLLLIWQEVSQDRSSYNLYTKISTDGLTWSDSKQILGPVEFYQEEEVALFTILAHERGGYSLAAPLSATGLAIYESQDGVSFQQVEVLEQEKAILSPQIYENAQGRPILFFSQDVEDLEGRARGLTLFYSQESDLGWIEPRELIAQEELEFNILPSYHSFNGMEYVVFQSLYTGTRITWQLYIKSRSTGSSEWGQARLITNFSENPQDRVPEFFSNQRARLGDDGQSLHLSWERNFTLESPQIFTSKLDEQGQIIEESLVAATEGYRYNAFPQRFNYDGRDFILWFDNRQGNQIIFSDLELVYRGGDQLSNMVGNSSYGRAVIFKGDLFFFWENQWQDQRRFVMLAPDKTVDTPRVSGLGFQNGQRMREQLVTFNWTAPRDSSGIRGYRYAWDRQPEYDPSLLEEQRLLLNPQPLSFQADEDGLWYFHLSAQDWAGNWSEPVHYGYNRDRTPPSSVVFLPYATDSWGYALSNTMELAWLAPPEEDTLGYNYSFDYVGQDFPDLDNFPIEIPETRVTQFERAMRFINRDNGWWALTVVALDQAGNVSPPSTNYIRLNKYQPVTYISWVGSSRDELDQIQLNITGRGFRVNGEVQRIYIDADGAAPYDYTFLLGQDFRVTSDRRIDGPLISVMEEGIYRIAVDHPVRGVAWARMQLSLDSTGTVKYGDFSQRFVEQWTSIAETALRMVWNDWTFYLLMALLLAVAVISLHRGRQLYGEARQLAHNSMALIKNGLIYSDYLKEEARKMKAKGLRLRAKFTLALLSFVIIIVLMVALFLGRYMINTQQLSLGQELQKRSALMLDTLVTGGRNYLPADQRIELRLLPNQIRAMEGEALWTTILGKGYSDPDNYNYIWSSNDENINAKQELPQELDGETAARWIELMQLNLSDWEQWYRLEDGRWILRDDPESPFLALGMLLVEKEILEAFEVGSTAYDDSISALLREMEDEINVRAREEIGDIKVQLEELSLQARQLALRTDAQSRQEVQQIQSTITGLSEEINLILLQIAEDIGVRSYPEFNAQENLAAEEFDGTYIFYKPILYSDKDSDDYYKGSVRLAITVDPLLRQLDATQVSILKITGMAFAGALLLGLIGAFLLSASMVRPIKELSQHVQIIAQTEDKKKLKEHVYPVKSRDEIGELGNIINNMTHGLVEAAKANEDLMAGKDIQKAFIPLEVSKISEKKHTTGKYEDDDVMIFGYYEGAKAVSGDYFDFRQLDDEHFAIIKCDIAGKGVAASLIMVEVATIFVNYFRSHKPKEQGVDLADLVWTINDLLNEVGFSGRFAAFNIVLLNKRTGQSWMCHAGDREVNIYDQHARKMYTKMLNDMPTAGSLDSDLLRMQNMEYKQIPHMLKKGDRVFLYTDGIEEAQNIFRDENFKQINCDGTCGATENDPGHDDENKTNHIKGESFEEFTTPRIHAIIESVLEKGSYRMTKYHDPLGEDHEMNFDYSMGDGSAEEAVLALIAAQFVFQLVPDPNAGELDRVMIDRRVDEFLKIHFKEYRDYFKYPVENKDNGEYIYYTHMKKDDQTDDLTILVVEKK